MTQNPFTHSGALPMFALAATLVACGGSKGGAHASSGSCQAPGPTEVATAVEQYIQKATPQPRRFLFEPTGDSALPDAGRQVLQNKGPTFLFPTDPAKQATVVGQLTSAGPYPALLVLYGGTTQPDPAQAVIHLRGRFVVGAPEEKATSEGGGGANATTPAQALYFRCQDDRWQFARAEEEKLS
jgi:hypothetical protein